MIGMKEIDNVNNPKHYKSLGAKCDFCNADIEHIQISRNFDFNRGNAIKYIWRSKFKGTEIEDLKKAIWYLEDYLNHCK